MAIFALHRGVRTEKRETILVIFDLRDGNLPAKHRVALRAVGAEFALMNVGVAISAVLADVRKDRFYVTLVTFHFFMHAAERIVGLVVVEFWHGADGPPGSR